MTDHSKTLIYPGAGWDDLWMPLFFGEKGMDNCIIYDTMPEKEHYYEIPGGKPAGYGKEKELLSIPGTLYDVFGPFTQDGNHLHFKDIPNFPGKTIDYYINTDAEDINMYPAGGVLIRGWAPDDWKEIMNTKGRGRENVFLSSDTWHNVNPGDELRYGVLVNLPKDPRDD